ncbi:MAG: hypothetical protein V4463_14505 [Pseudomonadota bacterium]
MTYSYGFKKKFAVEFANFPKSQQDRILDFALTFEQHGLSDFAKYPGKITPSWAGNANGAEYQFALANELWHYHVGIPTYKSVHPKFSTSDWVLHFQWKGKGNHVDLLDIYSHYRVDGTFYLPSLDYLA